MTLRFEVRDSMADESGEILALYPQAFPDEDLVPLVEALSRDAAAALSLVACIERRIIGHVFLTRCRIATSGVDVALLGPLAVAPASQRQGVGSALVQAGLARATKEGTALVCVLGDPQYYRRFGFKPERSLKPPYPMPAEWAEAWQSLRLRGGRELDEGVLVVPAPWQDRALWGP
jgi:putative acetyltransferase